MTTTPFEREVLTHHYTSGSPFPRPTELYARTVDTFVSLGLLNREGGEVCANCDALEPYMMALAAVPLPEQRWVIPQQGTR